MTDEVKVAGLRGVVARATAVFRARWVVLCVPVVLMAAVTRGVEIGVRRWHGTDAGLDFLVSFGLCAPLALYAEAVCAAMYMRLRRGEAASGAQWGEVARYEDVVPTLGRMTLMCAVWLVPALAVGLMAGYVPLSVMVRAVSGATRADAVMHTAWVNRVVTLIAEGAYGWFMARYALVIPQLVTEHAGGGEMWVVAIAKAVVRRRELRWICVLQYVALEAVSGALRFPGAAWWKVAAGAGVAVVLVGVAIAWCEVVKVELGTTEA